MSKAAARTVSHGTFTIEFEPAQIGGKAGTKLILTEQGAYLDGNQDGGPGREQGTKGLVEMLAKYLDDLDG